MASLSSDPIEPFLSIREWIQWHPSQEAETEPSKASATTSSDSARARSKEPTSTLVLTTAKRTFIDIRIFLAALDNNTSYANPDSAGTTAVASLQTLGPHPLPQSAVDWAMVGTSFSAIHAEGQPWHARWEHWIDSRSPLGSTPAAADEGFMFPQDGRRTLEKGSMVNPESGRLEDYEEMWFDPDVQVIPGKGESAKRWCVVLRLDQGDWKGAVVRVGQFVQGMIMGPNELCLERWEFDLDGEVEGRRADWRRSLRVGDRYLPCAVTWSDVENLEVGHEVKHSEVVWKVEEKYCW